MNSAKPASMKFPVASKGSSGRDFLFGDKAGVRFLCANIGGALILAAVSSLRPSDDGTDFTYEVALLLVGMLFYVYTYANKSKTKGRAPKVTRDNRSSTREPHQSEQKRARSDVASRRQQRQTPTFNAVGWEDEIAEFLRQVNPAEGTDAVLQALTRAVQTGIKPIVPEAKVACYTSLNLVSNNDVGSLEADVTIELEPGRLSERMEEFGLKKVSQRPKNDHQVSERNCALTMTPDELAKHALRMLTRHLAQEGWFLYHHCSYKEREPKVVLRVPACRGITNRDIFVAFTVNSQMPVRAATLNQQLELYDHRAFELGLLARRWARDRGVAYAAKGHLSPYAWTCLATFYLQQCCGDAVPAFGPSHAHGEEPRGTIGVLFQDFLRFYVNFDWRAGAISLRLGRQIPWAESSLGQPLDNSPLGIEDPFDPTRNLAETLTPHGFERLREELTRVRSLLGFDGDGCSSAGLKELLAAWVPPKDTP